MKAANYMKRLNSVKQGVTLNLLARVIYARALPVATYGSKEW